MPEDAFHHNRRELSPRRFGITIPLGDYEFTQEDKDRAEMWRRQGEILQRTQQKILVKLFKSWEHESNYRKANEELNKEIQEWGRDMQTWKAVAEICAKAAARQFKENPDYSQTTTKVMCGDQFFLVHYQKVTDPHLPELRENEGIQQYGCDGPFRLEKAEA